MKTRIPLAAAAIAAVATSVVVTQAPAGAASGQVFETVGWAGGSIVRAVNNTVTSAITAASYIEGPKVANSATNSAASINIPNIATAGAVTTSTQAIPISVDSNGFPTGVEVISNVKTANVNLFDGAIKIQAINTTAVATYNSSGLVSSDTSTIFVGATVGNTHIPITVGKNTDINIPGVARVILNVTFTAGSNSAGEIMTQGAGLYASLLKPRGQNAVGAEVIINPTYSAVGLVSPSLNHAVRGNAYATRVTAAVGTLANVNSDPTVPISMPGAGTNGVTKYNTIASANLTPLLQVGAVTTSARGVDNATTLDSTFTSEVTGLNLFNGAITADVIKATAHAHANLLTNIYSADASSTLVNLRIGGKLIPVNVKPNTVINIANLAIVTINQIQKTNNASLARVLDIKITTASYGLPVGAEIQLATATAGVI